MKKIICLLLAALMIMSCFVGCGGGNDGELTAEEQEILEQRRTIVEQNARWQASFRWTPAEDFKYCIGSSQGVENDSLANPEDVVTFRKGVIYEGIPYTSGVGSGYSFTETAIGETEDGVMILNLKTEYLSGANGQRRHNVARMGNNCADYIFWAWGMVDTTIKYKDTPDMTPLNGCVLVGDYELHNTTMLANTPFVVQSNGQQKMFRAYAQLQKADGVVHINAKGAGHAMMIVRNSTHYRDDGSIDGAKSYVTVLEQNSGCERYQQSSYIDPVTGQTIVRMQDLDVVFTYDRLAQLGYLPVTCKALVDPSPVPDATVTDSLTADEIGIENLYGGAFTSPYRISHVTIVISDKDGNQVQKSTMYGMGAEMYTILLPRFEHIEEQVVLNGKLDIDALASGEYTATYTVKLATGDDVVARSFTFTK